jgi:cobalamin synthase
LAGGLILAGLNYFLERYLESEILGTVHVMVLIIMTGAVHLEEIQKSFDLLSQRSQRAPDTPLGIYGLLAVLLIVLLKIRAIEVTGETRSLALLVTPLLARWAPLLLVYGGPAGEKLKNWHFIVITAVTLTAAGYLLGVAGLWVGLCLSLLALFARLYATRSNKGFDENILGSLIEVGESVSFVLFASL